MPFNDEPHASLALFDPLVADWFVEAVGQPTAIQTLAWPVIARGEHVLLSAPTGSGKTLTAFLFALERLLLGHWPLGTTRVLYVSPLKALNTDIARNLAQPLAALTARLEDQGADPPAIRIGVRSGDTTPAERAKMIRRPPEILVTTPESLNLLLASQHAPRLFGGLQTVILDEVHAIADGKRGVHLMTGIERLTLLAGEFQRVALSATVSPMSLMAAYVGGATWDGRTHTPRPVTQVAAPGAKQIELTQAQPMARPGLEAADRWRVAAEDIRRLILEHQTTLVFVNSRRAAERLTLAVNDGQPEPLAFSHHGSLSRETRQAVERRLKSGDLRAVIATGSLELGIDIGALDLVVMYETPPGVAATLQRVGRAGHGVGEVSRGVLLSPSGRDMLLATVMADCVAARELEPLAPPRGPLDVLCQVILGLCARDTWDLGDLYDQIRCAWSYHELPRAHFDRVIDLLAGRWARPGQPGLDTRLHVDRLAQTATANPKALRHLATQGGTIPDRGYFTLRVQSSGARLGELDEEYVFERSIGDRLVLGTQAWRIEAINANDVLVSPDPSGGPAPFWRAEDNPRETLFATRVAEFLEAAEGWLASGEGGAGIAAATDLSPEAVAILETYLHSQREATRSPLPHRHHLLAEQLDLKQSGGGLQQLVLHTHWGGRLNVPYALALAAACRRAGQPVRTYGNDNGVLLLADVVPAAADVLEWVRPDNLLDLLREQLPHAAVFGARFREAAGTAMVVSRGFPGRRTPLWLTRQRAKELLEATSDQPDFPLALEAWRACLQDQFDLPTLSTRLAELQAGEIDWSTCSTVQPSPFASGLAWKMTGELMYADDAPTSAASLTDQLLTDLVFDAKLRPALPAAVCDELAAKLARTAPGYAPGTAAELVDLVRDRVWLTAAEWAELLAAVGRDHGLDPAALAAEAAPRLATVQPPGGGALTMALEQVPWLEAVLGHELTDRLSAAERAQLTPPSADLEGLLLAWAAGRGAVALDAFTAALGLPPAQVDAAAAGLAARPAPGPP
ncbi:MAG TPA: ATP-dependent helicase, partial [Armatimonadetes bacterium]|nr:ATP-dependent helicase [Armatimonadota bacterium]